MIPTLAIRGWRFHLLTRDDDPETCTRWKTHREVESLFEFSSRLRNALRGDALFVSMLRRIVADEGMILGAMQMTDAELIREIDQQIRTGRLVAVECEAVQPVEDDPDAGTHKQIPRATVPLEGMQIHLLFGDDIPQYCPYHSGHLPFYFPDPMERERFIETLSRRQDMIEKARELLIKRLGPAGLWDASGETLFKKVVELVESRQLSAFRCRGTVGGGGGLGEEAATAAEAVANKSSSSKDPKKDDAGGDKKDTAPPAPVKTWIGIQLVDEEGNPAPFERYIIKLTDGTTQEGRLDGKGLAKFPNIDPGTCEIRFPDFDAKEWKAA